MNKTESITKRMIAFKQSIPVYRKSPKTFFKEILNFIPNLWQDEVSSDITNHRFVTVRSGQGVGKKLFMCGNPTKTSGFFFDSHNRDRGIYKTHQVSCLDSPRTSKENIEMLKRKYGEGSDVYRVRVQGQFPRSEAGRFITLEAAEHAAKEVQIKATGTTLVVGVDVARYGDDETAMYAGIGKKTVGQQSHFKESTMVTVGNAIRLAKDMLQQYPEVEHVKFNVDDTGVGGGVTDRLIEVINEEGYGWEVVPVNNGSSSLDEYCTNLVTEMW